jgi:hypothetical protein
MKSQRPFFSCTLHAVIADTIMVFLGALTILVLVVVVTEVGGECSCSNDNDDEDTT